MKKTNRLTEKRSERKKVFLKSGAYLIVTDAEKTEKNYFEGIKNIIPDVLKNDLQIKIYSNKPLAKIIDFATEQRNKDERFRDIWLVFDRDDSQKCCETFEKIFKENTSKKYKKSEEKIYNILCESGDENKAIERSREKYHQVRKEYSKPSKMIGCTTVYKLVEELKKKIELKK